MIFVDLKVCWKKEVSVRKGGRARISCQDILLLGWACVLFEMNISGEGCFCVLLEVKRLEISFVSKVVREKEVENIGRRNLGEYPRLRSLL